MDPATLRRCGPSRAIGSLPSASAPVLSTGADHRCRGTRDTAPKPPGPVCGTPSATVSVISSARSSKFATVGGAAFLVDFTIFNYAVHAHGIEQLTAKTISTVIAATFAFVGNRFWTWRHREHRNPAREYALFFLFNAVGLGIGLACLGISHYWLGAIWPAVFRTVLADNIASFLVGTGLGTLFRFWSYRRFVFRDAGNPPGPARDTQRGSPDRS